MYSIGVKFHKTKCYPEKRTENTCTGQYRGVLGVTVVGIARTDKVDGHDSDQHQQTQGERRKIEKKIHKAAGPVARPRKCSLFASASARKCPPRPHCCSECLGKTAGLPQFAQRKAQHCGRRFECTSAR